MSVIRLPKQWIEVALDDVVDKIVGGGTPSKTIPSYFQGNIPWMTVKDMNKFVLTDTVDHISKEAVENSATNIIPAGTPIIATRMSLGKLVRANFDSAINQDLKAIFINENVSKIYFEYWYRSISHKIQEMGTGTTVKGIRLEDIKQLRFAVAPLAEQQQIAQKLDELLAQVDTLKNRLDAIPNILKRFRQSVLAAAVSGRLTEEWRGEMNSENWTGVELLDVVQAKPRNGFSPQGVEYETQVKNLTLSATTSGVFKHDKYKYVDIEISDDSYLWLEPDDILIQRANSLEYVGVSAIYTGKAKTYTYPDLMMKCRANEKVLTKFLHYSLSSSSARKYFRENATGTTGNMPKINQGVVCSLPINLPSIQEQTEIVRRVEQLFAYADQIEQRVKDAQARVNHLTQSILAKAFRGELTTDWRAQNPELISGENSAAALLERIKAEREVVGKTKRKVKA